MYVHVCMCEIGVIIITRDLSIEKLVQNSNSKVSFPCCKGGEKHSLGLRLYYWLLFQMSFILISCCLSVSVLFVKFFCKQGGKLTFEVGIFNITEMIRKGLIFDLLRA